MSSGVEDTCSITGASAEKETAGAGATCSITGAGAAQVTSGVEDTCSITGASAEKETAGAGATCSITGAGAAQVTSGAGATHSITGDSSDASDPMHANLHALVHVSAPLSRVVSGTHNGHLDRDKLVAPHRSQFSLASSTREAQRSNVGGAFSHETERCGFHDSSEQQKRDQPT